jgi:hypothetical protein
VSAASTTSPLFLATAYGAVSMVSSGTLGDECLDAAERYSMAGIIHVQSYPRLTSAPMTRLVRVTLLEHLASLFFGVEHSGGFVSDGSV